ncbi:hypothetical protein I7I48_10814 [Histoplasma ohiense]|nr:hypothetical protein I7I48_10814 [Histoplasma ohiense (nom. inval.)]
MWPVRAPRFRMLRSGISHFSNGTCLYGVLFLHVVLTRLEKCMWVREWKLKICNHGKCRAINELKLF